MSVVAYLASYLSRGKFLTASFVANILARLVVWCLEDCKIHDGDINPKAHRVFFILDVRPSCKCFASE